MKRLLPLVNLLAISATAVSASFSFGLAQQRFQGQEHLIDIGSLGLPANGGLVSAFGDFNSDQLLDLFFLSSDQRTISVYEWDRLNFQFKESDNPLAKIRTEKDFVVVNIVPGDYNYDGKLDLLVMGQSNPGGWWGWDDTLEMRVYLQSSNGTFGWSLYSIFST